jgi:hypothetical protein
MEPELQESFRGMSEFEKREDKIGVLFKHSYYETGIG